jgi:tetratricopeptide (TPR) repeat protein
MALDYEANKQYANSAIIYAKLFELENNPIYLQRASLYAFLSENYTLLKKITLVNLDKYPKENEIYYRYAIISLLALKEINNALKLGNKLIKKYNNATNYNLLGRVYYAKSNYVKSAQYFESAYATNKQEITLVSLANILYVYLNQKKKAISYLETFIRLNGCKKIACDTLISFYREQQNIDGMIPILSILIKEKSKIKDLKFNITLLVNILEKKDVGLAIKFLEKSQLDNKRLLALYDKFGLNKKALKFVRSMYKETKNKELLGAIAIFEYQTAKNKQKVMKHVIANFEEIVKTTKNVNYKNYYGYLLINHNIDVKKGIKLVQEALKVSKNNIAYIDSLAWGYYKDGNCKSAYKYMKQVVNQVGLDNEEIKLHWEKINRCQK